MILPCRCHRREGVGIDVNTRNVFLQCYWIKCVMCFSDWVIAFSKYNFKIFSIEYLNCRGK